MKTKSPAWVVARQGSKKVKKMFLLLAAWRASDGIAESEIDAAHAPRGDHCGRRLEPGNLELVRHGSLF
jgi:hypothetical protein